MSRDWLANRISKWKLLFALALATIGAWIAFTTYQDFHELTRSEIWVEVSMVIFCSFPLCSSVYRLYQRHRRFERRQEDNRIERMAQNYQQLKGKKPEDPSGE